MQARSVCKNSREKLRDKKKPVRVGVAEAISLQVLLRGDGSKSIDKEGKGSAAATRVYF